MEFQKLNSVRQSCRNFKKEAITKEEVLKVIETASLTPSAKNVQPWRVKVVMDYQFDEVCSCFQENGRNLFLNNASVLLVIYESNYSMEVNKRPHIDFGMSDIGAYAYALTLAAKDQGLDSIIIGYINADKLADLLNLEKNSIRLMVALGHPNELDVLRKKNRLPLEEVVSFHEEK